MLFANKNDEEAVRNFQRYLQINTMHPNPNYDMCISFLAGLGESLGLITKVHIVHCCDFTKMLTLAL